MEDPLAYIASSEPDKVYFDQAMKQPERKEYLNVAIKEFNIRCEQKHWKLVPRSEVPKGQPILDLVYAMNMKRYIVTRQVYKWKARLNVYRGQQ